MSFSDYTFRSRRFLTSAPIQQIAAVEQQNNTSFTAATQDELPPNGLTNASHNSPDVDGGFDNFPDDGNYCFGEEHNDLNSVIENDEIEQQNQNNNGDDGDVPEPNGGTNGDIAPPPSELIDFFSNKNNWIGDLLQSQNLKQKQIPKDHIQPFDKFAKRNIVSKGIACVKFLELCARHCLKDVVVTDILEWLHDNTESLNLPVASTNYLKELKGETFEFRHNLKQYAVDDERSIVFDVCKRECIVFHGKQIVNGVAYEDCSKLMFCPVCKLPRYSKCTHADCTTLDYASCDPHNLEDQSIKHHSVAYRIPMRTVYYRFVVPKLLQLYLKSLTAGHSELLNYHNNRITRPGCIIDIADGVEVKKAYAEMAGVYVKTRNCFGKQHNQMLYQCSVVLTVFSDGKTNFQRSADSMRPLLCSVVNCNPTNRNRLGVGMFLVTLHNCKQGSPVEEYIQDKVMAEEFALLENGIIFNLLHPVTNEPLSVFLQARLLYAHLDTIELQKFFKVQGTNSDAGCGVCRDCPGNYRNVLKKHIYSGHRAKLHPNHMLRKFGQLQGKSLEEQLDFYGGKTGTKPDTSNVVLYKDTKIVKALDRNWSLATPKSSVIDVRGLKDVTGKYSKDNLWYNYKYPISKFQYALYYQMTDDRVLGNEDNRVSTVTYLTDGAQAELSGAPVNGVKGINRLVLRLKHFKYEYAAMHDLMHVVGNAGAHLIDCAKGMRGLGAEHKQLCIAQGVFPFLQFADKPVPWKLTNDEKLHIDSVANCLLIPAGYKDIFNLNYPMSRTGHLRAKDHIVFLTVYAPFVFSFTKLGTAYKTFLARFGDDLARLLNPCIEVGEVDELQKSILETKGIMEGIYPECMQFFIFHQLIDIVKHIKSMGHVRGLMCFGGERALSVIGRAITKGGVNYVKNMFFRYVALENSLMSKVCCKTNDPELFDNSGRYSDFVLRLYGEGNVAPLNEYQRNHLLERVLQFIESQVIDGTGVKSNLYRLNVAYLYCKTAVGLFTTAVDSFCHWLHLIYNRYHARVGGGATGLTSLVCNVWNDPTKISAEKVLEMATCGIIMESDINGIIREALHFYPVTYTKAIIKGLKFRGRGEGYCERDKLRKFTNGGAAGRREVFMGIKENYVECNWHKSHQYSSWCSITDHKYGYSTKAKAFEIIPQKHIAQFNTFFRLHFQHDSLIDGLAFADIALHNSQVETIRGGCNSIVSGSKSYTQDKMYVCLNYVDATALMVCPMDAGGVPICHSERYTTTTYTRKKDNLCINSDNTAMKKLYFIAMHPERRNYQYGRVDTDLDFSRRKEILKRKQSYFDVEK